MGDTITSRKLQAINTKNRIYGIALKIINQHGYDNVSVEEICKEAGISVGGFYHHFRNKDEIVIESFKQIDNFFQEHTPQVLQKANALEQIVVYFTLFGEYVNGQGMDFTSQLVKSEVSSKVRFTSDTDRPIFTILEKIVREGQSRGEIRNDLPSYKIASDLLRYARGIAVNWCINRGNYDIKSEMAEMFKMYIISLRPQ